MEYIGLGRPISGTAHRDAIHIAVAPVTANERLSPGQHVGFVGAERVGNTPMPIGVVDPFLLAPVYEGERFYLFLYPNTITGLRHNWSHPAFDGRPEPTDEHESWLRSFADSAGLSYGALLEGARDFVTQGEYLCQGGKWEGFSCPDEFWTHYNAVTGENVPEEKRESFFTCSC